MTEEQQDSDLAFCTMWFDLHDQLLGNGITIVGNPTPQALDFFNRILSWCEPKKMLNLDMILLLRSLYAVRENLSNYETFLINSRFELRMRGENADVLLQGLLR